MSGGSQYGNGTNLNGNSGTAPLGSSSFNSDSDGIGPTVFAEYERGLFGGLTLFSSIRQSLIFADLESDVEENDPVFGVDNDSVTNFDDTFTINELRVGISGIREYNGHQFLASTFLEYQTWESSGLIGLGDVGFAGIGFQLGMIR